MIEQTTTEDTSFNLVLSTWFIMYLRGDLPGGLPNDFLSRGASALLLFDKILCDKDALEAEERFAGTWLSSDIFLAFKQEGLLEEVNMREYLPQEFLDSLHKLNGVDVLQAAQLTTEAELLAIKKGEKKPKELQLPPLLTWLNHYMFMGLEIPHSLRYEWQEHHFKVPEISLISHPSTDVIHAKRKRGKEELLVSAMDALLPEFPLLPPIQPNSQEAVALRQNIAKEKQALYQWIFGDPDMPRDKYHELRLGPAFRLLDAKIDEPRKEQAWQNFQLLMKVRGATKDVRTSARAIISDVCHGLRTLEDVREELRLHEKELQSYLPSPNSVKVDVGLSGAGLALAVADVLGMLSGQIPGTVGGTTLAPLGGLLAYQIWRAKEERSEYRKMRQKYPLAWLLRDFRRLQTAEHKKQRRHRERK